MKTRGEISSSRGLVASDRSRDGLRKMVGWIKILWMASRVPHFFKGRIRVPLGNYYTLEMRVKNEVRKVESSF